MERCRSGWTGRSRKPLNSQGFRGFESPPLRHSNILYSHESTLIFIVTVIFLCINLEMEKYDEFMFRGDSKTADCQRVYNHMQTFSTLPLGISCFYFIVPTKTEIHLSLPFYLELFRSSAIFSIYQSGPCVKDTSLLYYIPVPVCSYIRTYEHTHGVLDTKNRLKMQHKQPPSLFWLTKYQAKGTENRRRKRKENSRRIIHPDSP